MALSRRAFIRVAGLVSAGTVAAGCAPIYSELSGSPSPLTHWPPGSGWAFDRLRRLTYGPTLDERLEVELHGIRAWLENQLNPEALSDEGAGWRLRSLSILEREADELAQLDKEVVIRELKQASLIRKVYSTRQLYEMMVEFWTDHFNISVQKGDCWFLKPVDDRQVIRRHAMGNFRDLLWASAHSPAMLVYLDNQANHRQAPNENYAREVMELHTLGLVSGYSQEDVMELARCLTGWGVKNHLWKGQFKFSPEHHDPDPKKILQMRIEPAGKQEAEEVLDRLALHPSTAQRIVLKLMRRFLSDDPEQTHPEVILEATRVFNKTQGEIRTVLKTIFESGLIGPARRLEAKLKRPMDFITSAVRMLHADTDGGPPLQSFAARMGQAEFEWSTPDGPLDVHAYWSTNLLPRWQVAYQLASNKIPGTAINLKHLLEATATPAPEELLASFSNMLLGMEVVEEGQEAFERQLSAVAGTHLDLLPQAILAGLLASPAFQWR